MTVGRDDIGQRSETVRRANLSAILRAMHDAGPLSRSDLVARTGLSRGAIRELTGELAGAGLVVEESPVRLGTPGRPSPLVRVDPEGGVVLALAVAVDSLAGALVGLGGATFEIARIDRPRGHSSVDDVVADLAVLARRVLDGETAGRTLVGIGVAVVGVVRRVDGVVAMAPNLGWIDVPLGRRLAAALATPVPILVANEADLGVLAEHRRGAAVGVDHVLYLSGEVGVGGGLIVDGRPMTGVAGFSGEVGHIPFDPEGRACRCGAVGCWETLVGEGALLRLAGHPDDGGRVAVDAVLRDAAAGSARALAALEGVGRWLGIGLAGLVNVLNPGIVVLGGLFGRVHPFVEATLAREMERRALPTARDLVRVVPARLGIDAPLLGAAELALEPLLADPAAWVGPRDGLANLASA